MFCLERKSLQQIIDHFRAQGAFLCKIFLKKITGAAIPTRSTAELVVTLGQTVKQIDERMGILKDCFKDRARVPVMYTPSGWWYPPMSTEYCYQTTPSKAQSARDEIVGR